MWARWCEVALSLWLLASPWLLAVPASRQALWAASVGGGAAVLLCAVLSMWPRPRRAHLVGFAIALALTAIGWFARSTDRSAAENLVVTGLVLSMLTIVPNEASQPPPVWRAGAERR